MHRRIQMKISDENLSAEIITRANHVMGLFLDGIVTARNAGIDEEDTEILFHICVNAFNETHPKDKGEPRHG